MKEEKEMSRIRKQYNICHHTHNQLTRCESVLGVRTLSPNVTYWESERLGLVVRDASTIPLRWLSHS